jgi:hypothetical protein
MAELHEIIDGITQMEEMLRSLASPCFVMRVSKIGQYVHFRYHGLLTLPLMPTTLMPGLVNTSLRHQISEHPNIKAIWQAGRVKQRG